MSNERVREKEINGRQYQFVLPSAIKGISICTRTGVLFGPLVTSFLTKDKKVDLDGFSSAVSKADPDQLNNVMIDAWKVSKLHCDGQPVSDNINFEKHFTAHPSDAYLVLIWILWETVTPFFPEVGILGQKLSTDKPGHQSPFPMPGARTDG